jgi:CDP-glucose 4,6-dehydratase
MAFANCYRGKRVLVTGHTGFKGSWLAEWLILLGAKVTGFALPPPTQPALFEDLNLAPRLRHLEGDVRDAETVRATVGEQAPDFIFHLAAQSLVRRSYREPLATYATNVMGTANVLEAVRLSGRPCIVVAIATDKCYESQESLHGHREDDPLGGRDPYSSSKAAAELVVSGYRRSFFAGQGACIRVASARAGNVVGGGDWAEDRIVPDCVRALAKHEPISVRNPAAIRPWQHVLEPLSGYLWLASRLVDTTDGAAALASAFNFGPALSSQRTVADLVAEVLKHWPGEWRDRRDPTAVHETGRLTLTIDKASHLLRWRPVWDFSQTMAQTMVWYRQRQVAGLGPAAMEALTRQQISDYMNEARIAGLAWAL